MFPISENWRNEERLMVISALSEKLIPLLRKGRLIDSQDAYDLAQTIDRVACASSGILQQNREEILRKAG